MQLFLNDIELDADKEHELISDSEFGFDVDIVYERDILIETLKGESIDLYESLGYFQHFNNCTEVHYRYDFDLPFGKPRIAFESDIHCTGCTNEIDHITSVHVRNAIAKAEDY